jgi:LysR family glycine cleavage system transcriptional activator
MGMPERSGGLSVADAGLAVDAAAAGFGVARVPLTLAEADIAAGRLVAVSKPKPTDEAYWLIAPTARWRLKKVRELVAALTGPETSR